MAGPFDDTDQLTPLEDLLNSVVAAAIGQVKSGTKVVTTTTVGTGVSVTVTFGTAFPSTPRVVVAPTTTVPENRAVGVSSISATGFTLTVTTVAGSTGPNTVQWVATVAPS